MTDGAERHGERIARVEERVAGHDEDLLSLKVLVLGPPREESLFGRVSKLETDTGAARAAEAALAAISAVQLQREENAERKQDFVFTKKTVLVGLVFSAIVLVQPWIVHLTISPHG